MKKVLLGTLAVLTLAACSKDEVIQQNPNDEISFTATAGKAISRAADGYCNKYLPGDFQVWAEVDGKTYFAGERYVFETGSTNTYVISGAVRYWPESTTQEINFYAACNKGLKADGVSIAESNIAIKDWDNTKVTAPTPKVIEGYAIESTVANQKDLLYAVVKKATRPSGIEGKIGINFRHALSQIEFMAKNENPNIYVEISQVKVCQVNSKGDFTFPSSTTDENINNKHDFSGTYPAAEKVGKWKNWDVLANYETTTFSAVKLSERSYEEDGTLTSPSAQATASGLTTKDDTDKEYSINTMYLLPQKFELVGSDPDNPDLTNVWSGSGKPTAGAYFLIKTKIWNVAAGDGTRTDDAHNVVLWGDTNGKDIAVPMPKDSNWEPGKRYVYTFVFTTTGNGGTDPGTGTPVLVPIKLNVTVDDFVNGFPYTVGSTTVDGTVDMNK